MNEFTTATVFEARAGMPLAITCQGVMRLKITY